MTISYKKAGMILVVLVACLSFILCGKDDNRNDDADHRPKSTKEIINFYHYWDESYVATIKAVESISERFNLENPAYRLIPSYINHEAFKVMIRNVEGNPPELFTYWAGKRTEELVDMDSVFPIDDMWEDEGLDKLFPKYIIDHAVSYRGKKYLVPITLFIIPVIYNVRVFQSLDIEPPTDWKEFKHVCDKLKQNGITPIALGAYEGWPAQYWFDYLLLRTAGVDYREKLLNGDASYTDPEVMRVFALWKELLDEGYFNPQPYSYNWDTTVDMVYGDEVGMTVMGQWLDKRLEDKGMEGVKDYSSFAFPTIDEDVEDSLLVVYDGLILHAGSESKSGAKRAMAYLVDNEQQKELSQATGGLSPNISIESSFYPPIKQKALSMYEEGGHLTYALDLSTPTPVAEIVLKGLIEFMEFPGQYRSILQDIDLKAKEVFDILDE